MSKRLPSELQTVIFREIQSAMKLSERLQKSFICYEDLKRIWSDKSRITSLLQLDPSQCRIDIIQESMIRIISTLIYVGATDCLANFRARLLDPSSSNPLVTDDCIPLEMDQLVFLESEPAKLQFYTHQFQFNPVKIVISKSPLVIKNHLERLPFEYRKKNIGSGGFGSVDLVGISPRYIKGEDGSSWETVYEVACKKIKHPNNDREADNLQILKGSLITHDRIMLHLTTIEHGHNRYILLPYAQYGDLEQFLHCGIGGERKYDFDEYFPDVRNGDVTHDLLRQCWSLANALEWLHKGIKNEKTLKTVFCVHMDLKPANILIQPDLDSKVGKWMISDFGISVLKEEAKPQGPEIGTVGDYATQLTMNTRPKRSRGTYQAPEVQTTCNQPSHLTPSQKGIGRKSDIWSYGCIFSEVLAFALGRDKYVNEFYSRRKGREGDNYFYIEKADQEHLRAPNDVPNQYQVHPSVLKWLDSLCRDQSWVGCWAETIKNILIVDTSKRPNATKLAELVNHIKENVERVQVTLREDLISRRNPSPPLDYIESPGDGDKDSITGDSDDSDTPSETPNGSSGAHPLIPMTSVEPEYAHGIKIYPDVRRTPKEPIVKELQRPGVLDPKATSVALTYSGGQAYAACLSKSLIFFYKLDVEEMSATLTFQPLELPYPNGWQGVAVGGFFIAAWGYSSKKKMLHLGDIRGSQPLQRWTSLPSNSIGMLERVAVSARGVAALLCGEKIVVVNICSQTQSTPLQASGEQKFTDVAFSDSGELLFAWAYGQEDSLYVWKCQDRVVNEIIESRCTYETVKKGRPNLTRVIPYNTYPRCIIITPDERFFLARVRSSPEQTSGPQPRDPGVKITNARAVCTFRDHSVITVEKKLLKEYKIDYEGKNSGVEIGRLKASPDKSSRLLVIQQGDNIIAIVCNLNWIVEFVKIVPV